MSGISILTYIVLTLSVAYAFIYSSMGEVSALTSEKQKYEEALEVVSNIETKKNQLKAQFDSISEEDKKEINTILPTSFEFTRLVSQIDAVAARHGISIDQITSEETSSTVGETIEQAGPERPYRSAVVGFTFEATYRKFTDFVDDLEKSMRILDIKTATVKGGEEGIHDFTVEFETYWLK